MKKNIFLLLSVTTLTACATFQQQQAFDWRGQNFDNYVLTYGVPTSQYTLQNGDNVYSFKNNCPDTNAQEELLITINDENVIQEVSLTATCPYVSPEPIQEIYVTRYIETPAPRPMPKKHAKKKPAPKPQPQVVHNPKPMQDKPAPKPQPQVAHNPKPIQDKPAPQAQPQVAHNPKPVQDKPAPKPQEQVNPTPQAQPKPQEKGFAPKQNPFSDKPISSSNQIIEKKDSAPKKDTILSKKLEKAQGNNQNVLFTNKIGTNTQKEKTTKTGNQKTSPFNLENKSKGLQALKR